MNILTLTTEDFEKIIFHLIRSPSHMAILNVRKNFFSDIKELICSKPEFYSPIDLLSKREKIDCFSEIAFSSSDYARSGYLPLMLNLSIYNNYLLSKKIFSQIIVEASLSPNICSGLIYFNKKFEPLHLLKLQGAGMKRIKSSDKINETSCINENSNISSLNFCLIGPTMNLSLLALSLLKIGVKNFSFIDTGLDEMVEIKSLIRDNELEPSLRPFINDYFKGDILSHDALNIMRRADLFISSVDCDTDSFWINLISVYFMKPLLDISNNKFQQWFDVKLLIPDDGCLYCRGNFSDLRTTLHDLYIDVTKQNKKTKQNKTKNEIFSHQNLLYFTNFLKSFLLGNQKETIWLRFIGDKNYIIEFKNPDCPFCSNI